MVIHSPQTGPETAHEWGECSSIWELIQAAYEEDRYLEHDEKAAEDEKDPPTQLLRDATYRAGNPRHYSKHIAGDPPPKRGRPQGGGISW